MNPQNLDRIIATAAELGATKALERLGHTSGELSEREALRTYGAWFRRAVQDGRLAPCRRTGEGPNARKIYKVDTILATRMREEITATLKIV